MTVRNPKDGGGFLLLTWVWKCMPPLPQFLRLTTGPSELPALSFVCEKAPVLPAVVPGYCAPCTDTPPRLTAGGNWAPGKTHLGCSDHASLKQLTENGLPLTPRGVGPEWLESSC